ncbi:DUF1565 domain-containing protein [Kitasatospora arboriphila]
MKRTGRYVLSALLAGAALPLGVAGSPPAQAASRTYYVSTAGSDSNPGTSPSKPFRTLQKAADSTAPGDAVSIMNGTYTERAAVRTSWRSPVRAVPARPSPSRPIPVTTRSSTPSPGGTASVSAEPRTSSSEASRSRATAKTSPWPRRSKAPAPGNRNTTPTACRSTGAPLRTTSTSSATRCTTALAGESPPSTPTT